MAKVIANNIINAAKVSVEAGKEKHKTYFVKYAWYKSYKADVDAILKATGNENLIVTA